MDAGPVSSSRGGKSRRFPSLGILRFGKIPKFALVGREGIRPSIAFVEHLCDDIAEGHVATLERKQSLIHLGINPYRSPLACTRHNYHSVVTPYKFILKITV